MKIRARLPLLIALFSTALIYNAGAKTTDPYKVLGVERDASQRQIQKAFHKLSLQYHPDKNKNKGAQEKFAQINNAYEILSDEEKRKNYDLYGDEKGNSGFDGGYPGDQGGHTYFTSGGPGQDHFNFRPGESQHMGGKGSSEAFSFSFGGPSSYGFEDLFSGFFGGNFKNEGQFGGSGGPTGSRTRSKSSPRSFITITSQVFKKEIVGKGMTWLLFSHVPSLRGNQHYESIAEEVANSLQGALKVGSINCETESSLCNELGIHPRRAPRLFVYSYKASNRGSLVEYNDDLVARKVKTFCQEHLPRFSKRTNLNSFDFSAGTSIPRVMLLSTKKDTPVIWRVLSGLYHERFIFYDVEVHDVQDPKVKKLGVDALPAIVGWLSNGEKHVIRTGISSKDITSAINDLSALLNGFEKKNRKVASTQSSKPQSDSTDQIPLLRESNFDDICGDRRPVCIIGAFRSRGAREELESVLYKVSQKSLSRRKNVVGSRDSISYSILDTTKQKQFLNAFDKSGFNSSDKFLIAYKPQKGKFAAFLGEISIEEVERFVSSVLNGDIQFTKSRQKPVLR